MSKSECGKMSEPVQVSYKITTTVVPKTISESSDALGKDKARLGGTHDCKTYPIITCILRINVWMHVISRFSCRITVE